MQVLKEFTSGADLWAHLRAVKARQHARDFPKRPRGKVAATPEPAPKLEPPPPPKPRLPQVPVVLTTNSRRPWGIENIAPPKLRIEDIRRIVAIRYGRSKIDMLSDRRGLKYCRPRQVAMYLCREFTTHSLAEIGRWFGNKDHTTILSSIRRIEELKQTRIEDLKNPIDRNLAAEVATLKIELEAELNG